MRTVTVTVGVYRTRAAPPAIHCRPMSDPSESPAPPVAVVPRRAGRFGAALSAASVALVVALWGVTAAGRVLAAPPAALAGVVVFLPYLYLGAAMAVFAGWTVAPDRRTPPSALAVLVATALWLWTPGRARAPSDPQAAPVRVMTWNVQRLWGGDDARACTVEVLRSEAPDVVALLEVTARDVADLSAAAGLECRHHTYTSDTRDDRGGLATCARRDGPWRRGRWDSARFVDDEDWYYQLAEFTAGEHRFNLLAAHLYPYRGVARKLVRGVVDGDPATLVALGGQGAAISRGQADQAAALLARVAGLSDPTVVAGDFNSTPDAALHVALRERLTDAWDAAGEGFGGTVRLFGLPLRVDYLYASVGVGVQGARVLSAGCSDHEPVVAELLVAPR